MRWSYLLSCVYFIGVLAFPTASFAQGKPKIILNTSPSDPKSIVPDFNEDPFAEPDFPKLTIDEPSAPKKHPSEVTEQADATLIKQVEDYLNSITTLQAKIIQHNRQGFQEGTLYLSRPGKMRLNYDHSDDHIVADGTYIYFWDSEWENYSHAPIGSTIADAFLRKKISLSGDLKVSELVQGPSLIDVTIIQREDPSLGELTLSFARHPFMLTSWRVRDSGNSYTDIRLIDPKFGLKLSDKLFHRKSNLTKKN